MAFFDRKLLLSMLKGAATYLPAYSIYERYHSRRSFHSGRNARFCYSLWLRNLVFLAQNNVVSRIASMAELGTGGSLGIGICALFTNADSYCALEVEDTFDCELNIKLVEELYDLFRNNTSIPDDDEFPQINLKVHAYHFPKELLIKLGFNKKLIKERLFELSAAIRSLQNTPHNSIISIQNSWVDTLNSRKECFNYIFSRAVMEHVSSPKAIYHKLSQLLVKNGLMFHDIEFHSHNITGNWDGHYHVPNCQWAIVFGKRKYFLNRCYPADHLEYVKNTNLKVLSTYLIRKTPYFQPLNIHSPNPDDSSIYGMSFLAQKLC